MARVLGIAPQDKDEKIPHTFNWARELNGATISNVSWSTGGLTNESTAQTTTLASIRVAVPSSVSPGQTCILECTVTASDGAIYQAQILIPIEN